MKIIGDLLCCVALVFIGCLHLLCQGGVKALEWAQDRLQPLGDALADRMKEDG